VGLFTPLLLCFPAPLLQSSFKLEKESSSFSDKPEKLNMNVTIEDLAAIDNRHSKRHIDLDPGGYFLIYLDWEAGQICAKHFTNVVDDRGLALDPETGKPLMGKLERTAETLFTGRTAKELCMQIFEQTQPTPVTKLDHAAYLGREFVRAENALVQGNTYVQD
jgi:dihydropteroate synthase